MPNVSLILTKRNCAQWLLNTFTACAIVLVLAAISQLKQGQLQQSLYVFYAGVWFIIMMFFARSMRTYYRGKYDTAYDIRAYRHIPRLI